MRKIIKFLSSLLIFLFEIFLVIVFIVEVAVSSLIMQRSSSAILSYFIYRKGHYVAKIVHTGVGTLLYASWYMYLYFTCEIYMSDTLYPGVFTVFIAPYQIAGLVVLIVIYVSLYFYKRRKLKDNDQRNQANIRSC